MTTLSRDFSAVPRPTSAVSPQRSTDVRPAPRCVHRLWALLLCAVFSAGAWSALYGLWIWSTDWMAGGATAMLVSLAALIFEAGWGEMRPNDSSEDAS